MTTRGRAPGALFVGTGLLALGMLLFALLLGGSSPAKAETGKKALILDSSVSGGASSTEATEAVAKGFTVTLADDATWGAMTAAQFADFQLLVVGDPTCSVLPAVVSQNATALADAVMARVGGNAKAGNRILIGTDPVYHLGSGGDRLVATGIDFAGVQDGASNLYLDFSCFDQDYDSNGVGDGQDKLLPLLTIDPTPGWTQNTVPPCGAAASLISNAAQFSTLTSANLQGWFCSVHMTFPTFPTDWTALAIATDTPTAPTCGTDVDSRAATCGEAYVLIAGTGIVAAAPNLALDPLTAENPVGTTHTVTATVTNPDDSPRSGVAVSFVVTGVNAGATGTCVPADCTSNADGKVTFTYTGAAAGDDTINASITVDGSRQTATAAKTWVAAAKKATSTTTAAGSVQYSDAAVLTGRLEDTSVSPAIGIADKTLVFELGTQSTSGGPTDASGDASKSLTVTQLPGSVSSVNASFAGDSSYESSSDTKAFSITKEDCTLAYSGATSVAPTASTRLAADFGELDTSLGDRSNKLVTFTVTDAANVVQTFTATTNASGIAETTQALGSNVYGVSVSFAGDSYYKACSTPTDTLVVVQAAGSKVTGGGWISISTGRTNFGFNAIPEAGGLFKGQFQLRSNNGKNRFHGKVVSSLSGTANTATWSGTGSWNGSPGYKYTISVVDNGSSGSKKADTITITITSPSNTTVYSTSGSQTLKGGNITVH